jgi:protein TonB
MPDMTIADGAPPIQLPANPEYREGRNQDSRFGRMRWGAIIATALFHGAVLTALLVRWPFDFEPKPIPPPIAVTLVAAPPPQQPAPAPTAASKPPPPPQKELQSGPDQVTTAPPTATDKGEAAAPQTAELPDDKTGPEPVAKPKPTPPAAPKQKEAARETAPRHDRQGSVDRAPGEEEKSGDPYLNALWGMIEQHRTYPDKVGPLGLKLEGTAVYLIAVLPDGTLRDVHLQRSAGDPALDDTARNMIQGAAPFPPLPSYYPRNGVLLSVTIHIFPGAG